MPDPRYETPRPGISGHGRERPRKYDLYFNTIRGKEASLRFGGAREATELVASALLD